MLIYNCLSNRMINFRSQFIGFPGWIVSCLFIRGIRLVRLGRLRFMMVR